LIYERESAFHGLVFMIAKTFTGLHLEKGRFITSRQAHHFFNDYQTVRGGFPYLNTQVGAQFFQELICTPQGAGKIGADLEAVFPTGFCPIECVKTND
jgi:uncharacterized 2Fe-2S/4Fe-4S cluster protein (DUF4445 family)